MSKYHNVKTVVDGIAFDSKREAERYRELKILHAAGVIEYVDRQYRYHLVPAQRSPDGKRVPGIDYVCDFRYRENGKLIVEDVKGVKTDAYKIKKKLMLFKYGVWIRET